MLASLIYLQKLNLPLRVSKHYPLNNQCGQMQHQKAGPYQEPIITELLEEHLKSIRPQVLEQLQGNCNGHLQGEAYRARRAGA